MDKIKVYQDVLNEGHYKLLSDNLEIIKEDDLLLFEEGIPGFEDLSDFIIVIIIVSPFDVYIVIGFSLICPWLFLCFPCFFLGFLQGKDFQHFLPNLLRSHPNPSLVDFLCFGPR